MTKEAASRLKETATATDEHFRVEFEQIKGGLVATILAR